MSDIAVLSSDWHVDEVGRGAWRRRPGLTGDSAYALHQIINLCIERRLPLLGAGDLLDTAMQEGPSAVQCIRAESARFRRDAAMLPIVIRGNHDMNQGPSWLELADCWCRDRKSFDLGGYRCYGIDYTRPGEIKEALASVPKDTVLLMMHQAWSDWMGEERSHGCKFADLPHARFLLTGDYHQSMVRAAHGASGQSLTVCSPGAACLRSISEPDTHRVYVLRDDLTVSPVPLRGRPIVRRSVEDEDGLLELLRAVGGELVVRDNQLPAEVATPILDVVCATSLTDAYKRISDVAGDRYHLFFRAVAGIYDEPEAKRAVTAYRGQLADNLVKVLPEGTPENLVAGRLLGLPATEQKNELRRLMQSYLDNGEITPSVARLET